MTDDELRAQLGLPRTLHEAVIDLLAVMQESGEPPLRAVVSRDPQTGRVDVYGPFSPVDAALLLAKTLADRPADLDDVDTWVGYWQGAK